MSAPLARVAALTYVVLLVVGITLLVQGSRPGSGTEVRAEFNDAFPLLEGMHVRIAGAVAGSVDELEITDRGTALVTMRLREGVQPPKSDATASVRQEDLLGDSYLSLSPGRASAPLRGTIPTSRTASLTRLDEMVGMFQPRVRRGLQVLLAELGTALEGRGEDLNTAVVRLRPALKAAERVTNELSSQNAALRGMITDAQRVTGQAAPRSRDLGQMVDALAETLRTVEGRADELGRGIDTMPETLVQARQTLSHLEATTGAAVPLARELRAGAGDLAATASLLDPFLEDTTSAARRLHETLPLTRDFLHSAHPTFTKLTSSLADLRAFAPEAAKLTAALQPGMKGIASALFGASHYGEGPGRFNDKGSGATSVESGNQPGSGAFNDPMRNYNRAVEVLSCQTFGYKIRPGCLDEVLAGGAPRARRRTSSPDDRRSTPAPGRGSDGADGPDRKPLKDGIDELLGGVKPPRPALPKVPDLPGKGRPSESSQALLDFLFGP